MDSPRSSGSVRRHVRNISHPVAQRTTRGPLEEAIHDPLADSQSEVSAAAAENAASDLEPSPFIPAVEATSTPVASTAHLPVPASTPRPRATVDLRFLQSREHYHSITAEDIPSAFLNSSNRPSSDASLPDLINGGHFRRAAESALRAILQSSPTAAEHILELLYVRLACLVLVSRPDLAAAEAIPLLDLLARNPPGTHEVLAVIPWDLRILLVRLQSLGVADGGRRGIMALYNLASEVRVHLRHARSIQNEDEIVLWTARLHDIGLRVSDALVEMGELETAARHLDTLSDVDPQELAYRKSLLRIRVGDIAGSRKCAEALSDGLRKKGFEALLQVADGDYSDAVDSWQSLMEEYPGHEQFALNAATSLLYTGHIASARDVLEDLAKDLPLFPTLLFNLSTVYELCSERAMERKIALSQQAAEKRPGPNSGGWERSTFEFKL